MKVKCLAAALCAALLFPVCVQAGAVVLPAHSTVGGKTLQEYSGGWWQYVFSVPAATNPLLDETGANAHVGQSGDVFYLVGKFDDGSGNPVVAERSVTITDKQYVFFPLVNYQVDNIFEDPPKTDQELQDAVKANIDQFNELHASIDGVAVPDLFSHRETSPAFSYSIPENSIYSAFGIDLPAQTVTPVFSDGYWLMVSPLAAGQHDINFGGSNTGDPGFNLDVTYHVTVTAATIPLPAAIWPGISLLASIPIVRKLRRR